MDAAELGPEKGGHRWHTFPFSGLPAVPGPSLGAIPPTVDVEGELGPPREAYDYGWPSKSKTTRHWWIENPESPESDECINMPDIYKVPVGTNMTCCT